MNILHLSAVNNWGGGENHLENLCMELKDLTPESKNIIFCNADGPFRRKLENGNIDFVPAQLSFKMDPRYFFNLIRVCQREKIDLIHIHDTTALTLAVMGDKFYNLPPFVLSKKTSFPIKNRKQTLYKYNYSKIRKILCVSKATKEITAGGIIDKTKLTSVYHGTNINVIQNESSLDLRKELNLQCETVVIGNIANHIRSKDLKTFIRVAEELIHFKKIKNIHFVQIGSFTGKSEGLLQFTREKKLEKHISYLNFIPGAASLIPQFDISLLTSQSEGMPQFIYESLYHGVPVVSTDVGGIPEVIHHNKNGLLAPAHHNKKLAQNVKILIEDPELREKFTKTSRENIEKNFTTRIMAQKTLEVYKEILNGRHTTGNR